MTLILSPLAVGSIRLYQHYVSPLKGFRCAYGAESGVKSCSAFGRHVFARYDVSVATALLQRRFDACRSAYERYKARAAARKQRKHAANRQTKRSRCDGGGSVADCTCNAATGACDVGACL